MPVVGDAETLDFEQLLALRPTVVVVAVDVVQRVRIDRIRSLGIPVYQVHVTSLAQMPESLRRLGELTGTAALARRARRGLRAELDATGGTLPGTHAGARALPDLGSAYLHDRRPARDQRRAAVCGARNIFADLDTAAPAVTREAAHAARSGADPGIRAARQRRRLDRRMAASFPA